MIPDVYLHKCYKCQSSVAFDTGTSYYKWLPIIRCTNPKCKLMMLGEPYGNNGFVKKAEENRSGEMVAYLDLADRWNKTRYVHDKDGYIVNRPRPPKSA